jgi:hypothetical protein
MGDVHVKDEVAYLAFKEAEEHVHLFECMCKADQFNMDLNEKLERVKRSGNQITKKSLRVYLQERKKAIEKILDFTIVTDFNADHLLTLPDAKSNFMYVYFGAMTKLLISVACWLRIPMIGKKIDMSTEKKPEIFFWVLHRSYAQDLEGLGEGDIAIDEFKATLKFSQSIEYP